MGLPLKIIKRTFGTSDWQLAREATPFPARLQLGHRGQQSSIHGLADARLERQFVRMQLAAQRLVMASRHQIEIVAAALLRHGTLTGDEIIAQLNGATEPVSWL